MSETKNKESKIEIKISLDSEKIPKQIQWHSEEAHDQNEWLESKAFSLSFFDKASRDTLRMDLWTKEFQVSEMDRFVFNSLKGIADSYFKATNNAELANDFQSFIHHFGKKTKILD